MARGMCEGGQWAASYSKRTMVHDFCFEINYFVHFARHSSTKPNICAFVWFNKRIFNVA